MITNDGGIVNQQNLAGFNVAVLLVHPPDWNVQRAHVEEIIAAIDAIQPSEYRELRLYPNDN